MINCLEALASSWKVSSSSSKDFKSFAKKNHFFCKRKVHLIRCWKETLTDYLQSTKTWLTVSELTLLTNLFFLSFFHICTYVLNTYIHTTKLSILKHNQQIFFIALLMFLKSALSFSDEMKQIKSTFWQNLYHKNVIYCRIRYLQNHNRQLGLWPFWWF